MRKNLRDLCGERLRFRGTFMRFGEKHGWNGTTSRTLLLCNIADSEGRGVTDHLWFNETKAASELHLQAGDIVEFDGRITSYTKGYRGMRPDVPSDIREDYRISHPTGWRKVGCNPPQAPPPPPETFAHYLKVFQTESGVSDTDLARMLDMPEEKLDRLRGCRLPRPGKHDHDLAWIASTVQASPFHLSELLQRFHP